MFFGEGDMKYFAAKFFRVLLGTLSHTEGRNTVRREERKRRTKTYKEKSRVQGAG